MASDDTLDKLNSYKTNTMNMKTNENQSNMTRKSTKKYIFMRVFLFAYFHITAIYGLYLCSQTVKWKTLIFLYFVAMGANIGVTAGAHRLWSHRTYKAKWPLEILLLFLYSLAFQNSVINWVKDHRLHHKHSDTEADPHNARRGFYFSHIGWLLMYKNDDVKKYGKLIDSSDVYNNRLLKFHDKYSSQINGMICFVFPVLVPIYYWGETLHNAWNINILRFILNLHTALLINSLGHRWGYRPYDKNIFASQHISLTIITLGEGYHNYHHVFPWDYRTAELGNNWFNLTTRLIDFFAWIGWAYDRKSAPEEMIKARAKRTGDGTNLWGWDDKDNKLRNRNTVFPDNPYKS